jgi:hypothetical protein
MVGLAKMLVILGLTLAFIGALLLVAVRFLPWLGNLPGDLSYESENIKLYVPLGTMIVVSVVGTLLLNVLVRIFNR